MSPMRSRPRVVSRRPEADDLLAIGAGAPEEIVDAERAEQVLAGELGQASAWCRGSISAPISATAPPE